MPEEIIFDKTLDTGTLYRAEEDKYFVIEKVGTNSTAKPTYLEVDGKRVLEIFDTIAPLKKASSNLLGMLDISDNPIIVPPTKTFVFYGSSSSVMRIVGKLGKIVPPEAMPGGYAARFAEQHKAIISFLYGAYSFQAATQVDANTRVNVINWDCPIGEEWKFDRFLGVEAWKSDNSAAADLKFYVEVEGIRYDVVQSALCPLGFSAGSAPFPPRDAVNKEPFDVSKLNLVFIPGKTLKIDAENPSTLSAPSAGVAWQFRVVLVGTKSLKTI